MESLQGKKKIKKSKNKKRLKSNELFNLGSQSSEEDINQYDPENPSMIFSSLPSASKNDNHMLFSSSLPGQSKDDDLVQDYYIDDDFPPIPEYGHHSILHQRVAIKNKEVLTFHPGEKKNIKTACIIKPSFSQEYFLYVRPNEEKHISMFGIEEGGVKIPSSFGKRVYINVNNMTKETHVIPADTTIAYMSVSPWKY